MDDVFTKLNDLESKLSEMDQLVAKIDQLGARVEEMKPETPVEKLEMRSLDSYPFNEKPKDFFDSVDPVAAKTAKKIFKCIQTKHPKLELVVAWNQPMLKLGTKYVFGLSVAKNHILLAPWSVKVLDKFRPRLSDYEVNKKTFAVPLDWAVDASLLQAMVKATISEVG